MGVNAGAGQGVRRLDRHATRSAWPGHGFRRIQQADAQEPTRSVGSGKGERRAGYCDAMNENFSLVVMIFFMIASLAFLAQQISTYR
jgi:hypothetical protein